MQSSLIQVNKRIKIRLIQTPVRARGHGCDRCGQESHLVGIVYKMELMGWEGEGSRLADVSRGCACYWHSCHLRSSFHPSAGIDQGSPLLCNMTQMMDLLLHGMCRHMHADTYKGNTWTNTLSLLDTHTHTHLQHTLARRSVAAVICHLDPYQLPSQICPHIILLDLSRQRRFRPELQMRSWHAKVMSDYIYGPSETFLQPNLRCWHHPPCTAAHDLWAT